MTSVLERRGPVLISLKVDVPQERVQKSLDAAYAKLQRSARIRGFRPGKVPRHVVKQLLGKSVRQELASELVEESLGDAFVEHGLQPIAVANVDAQPLVEGEALRFTADIEVRPTIESIDVTKLEVYRDLEPVTDEDVERELTRLRDENAELTVPDPARPATNGDVVTFDMHVELDGRERPDLAMRDSQSELGSHHLLEVIETGLVGLGVGDTKEIELPFAADHAHEELRGKTARCTLTMKTIQAKHLPALDDDFAKDLEHESVGALRSATRARFEKDAEERAAFRLREQVIERLVDQNPIVAPPTLIERQARAMMTEVIQFQRMLGAQVGLDETMQAGIQLRAGRKVQAGLLLAALAQQESLRVEQADLDRKFAQFAERTGKHVAKVRAEHTEERLAQLRNQVLEEKLVEWLLARATVRDGKPPERPAPTPADKTDTAGASKERAAAASADGDAASAKKPKRARSESDPGGAKKTKATDKEKKR